jgi:hypothetical protein
MPNVEPGLQDKSRFLYQEGNGSARQLIDKVFELGTY